MGAVIRLIDLNILLLYFFCCFSDSLCGPQRCCVRVKQMMKPTNRFKDTPSLKLICFESIFRKTVILSNHLGVGKWVQVHGLVHGVRDLRGLRTNFFKRVHDYVIFLGSLNPRTMRVWLMGSASLPAARIRFDLSTQLY